MKRKMAFFLIVLSFCFIRPAKAAEIYNDKQVGSYEVELAKFPCDYQNKIKELHKIYPNAVFVAQDKFFTYNSYQEVPVNWNQMLSAQAGARSLIYYTAPANYKTSICAQKSGSGCSWYQATPAAITYYMNPYNFLNEKNVFMFESLYAKNYHTKEGIEKILKGSFMENKTCPGSEKTYADVLLEAGEKNNVSPYMLAARLIQEQGTKGTSSLISGTYKTDTVDYTGFYNYFNISASGKSDSEVIENGLKKAKEEGWDSPYKAIVNGSKFVYIQYVGINDTYYAKGQMTLYLQKFDPYGPQLGAHQYMQNIQAPVSESSTTYNSYAAFNGYKNFAYVFYIPIFVDAPNTTNTSCNVGTSNTTFEIKSYKVKDHYLTGIGVGTTIDVLVSKIKSDIPGVEVSIQKNSNNTSNKLATSDTVVIEKENEKAVYQVVIYGDVNGDGNVWPTDYAQIKNHIKGTHLLTGIFKEAADVNKDGNVWPTDYVQVKNYIKGTGKINQ